jgi:HD-GYP domain-containing protein (c-di-GMP phosphodiesterase class II)
LKEHLVPSRPGNYWLTRGMSTLLPATETSVQTLLRKCSEHFGSPFTFWQLLDTTWHAAIVPEPGSDDAPLCCGVNVADLLPRLYRPGQPAVEPVTAGHCIVIVPAPGVAPAGAAVGIVASAEARLVRQLASAINAQVETDEQVRIQQRYLDEFADQAGTSMDELVWLHSLISQMQGCDIGNSLSRAVETVLPSLVELLKAEAVVFIPQTSPMGNGAAAHGSSANVAPQWAGQWRLDASLCQTLVDSLGGGPDSPVVVRNDLREDRRFADENRSLRSCLLCRVATEARSYGWMLALNKRSLPHDDAGPHAANGLGDAEFGTCEAGLLDASARLLATHAWNYDLFREQETILIGMIRTLIYAIDAKDPYTCGHSDRVALYARRIAGELGLDLATCQRIYVTGLLHDIGKIGVPDHILHKPGRLTAHEFEVIKQHPRIGHTILKHLTRLSHVLPGLLHHHEAVDGSGYPDRLAGPTIPLEARILAVADAYDAMTSRRPYREPLTFNEAESILRDAAGQQWDSDVVTAFFRCLDDIRAIATGPADELAEFLEIDGPAR